LSTVLTGDAGVDCRYQRKPWTIRSGRHCLAEKFLTNQLTCQTLNWHGWYSKCVVLLTDECDNISS